MVIVTRIGPCALRMRNGAGNRLKPGPSCITRRHGAQAIVAPQVSRKLLKLPRVYRAPLLLKHMRAGGYPDVRGQGVHASNSTEILYMHTVIRRVAATLYVRSIAKMDASGEDVCGVGA